MGFVAGLVLYVLFLAVYWFFVLSILWHVREYIVPEDGSRWVIWVFLATIVALNIISLALFFSIKF